MAVYTKLSEEQLKDFFLKYNLGKLLHYKEIKEGIEVVATILQKLPELMPQFNMNTNPLQPIFEAFARKLSGEAPLMTYEAPRDSDGRFHGATKDEEKEPQTS